MFRNSDKIYTYKHEPWYKKIKQISKRITFNTESLKAKINNLSEAKSLKEDILLTKKVSNQINECNTLINEHDEGNTN